MFYGADINSNNALAGNPKMTEMMNQLTQEGYQVQSFAGRGSPLKILSDPVRDAASWLLSNLDTNNDGVYDSAHGDISRPIEIFGYSNGGIEVSFLANRIKDDKRFKADQVSVAIAIDPVSAYMSGNGRVPNTVYHYYNYYQTDSHPTVPAGVLFFAPLIRGFAVDSDAFMNTYNDIFATRSDLQDIDTNHTKIVATVSYRVIDELEQK